MTEDRDIKVKGMGMMMEGKGRCGEGAMRYLLRNRQLGARHVLTVDMIAKSADY